MQETFFDLKDHKKMKLVNVALKQFARNGYKKTVTEAITAEAKVSKGLLFHYFGSKKALYLYLYDHSISFVKEKMQAFDYESKHDLFEFNEYGLDVKCDIMRQYPYLFEFLLRCHHEQDIHVRDKLNHTYEMEGKEAWDKFLQHMDGSKFKEEHDVLRLIDIIIYCGEGISKKFMAQEPLDIDAMQREVHALMGFLKKSYYREEYL